MWAILSNLIESRAKERTFRRSSRESARILLRQAGACASRVKQCRNDVHALGPRLNLFWAPAQLAVLAKVVDLNGFSAAARSLGVPKAAVSRAVADLEKTLGVRIAMDDFGTGYSSLSYLQAFPFDKIKIDRTFIANLGDNQHSAAIVRAVLGLGRGMNIPVVAEGVETPEQLAFLARESCEEVQGYLIGRPAPIDTYASVLGRKAETAKTKLRIVNA